jgi:hypothetical protein
MIFGNDGMDKQTLFFLRMIGVILVIVGIVAAYYGPLEIFCFYLFSEGGQFHYEGFGFGSFWFAALVVQNIGYYIIAFLCLPLGIGHIRMRRWALTLTRLYLCFWLGKGMLLIGNGIFLLPSLFSLGIERKILLMQVCVIGVLSFILLLLVPALLMRFYGSEKVKAAFESHDSNRYWTERYPFLLLALLFLFLIMIVVFHLSVFFQGVFPLFGHIQLGRPSAYLDALCILILVILIYGTVQMNKWAWVGSLVFTLLLTISTVMTFSTCRFYDIILMMKLPAYEMEFINKMKVLHDFRLVGLFAVPLLAALGLIVYSKRYFIEEQIKNGRKL